MKPCNFYNTEMFSENYMKTKVIEFFEKLQTDTLKYLKLVFFFEKSQ